jgi:hypothetical protein
LICPDEKWALNEEALIGEREREREREKEREREMGAYLLLPRTTKLGTQSKADKPDDDQKKNDANWLKRPGCT